LTPRERAVLAALLDGLSLHHIAERLNISPVTVENHLKNIRKRSGIPSLVRLAAVALREQWLKPETDEE
jgi:DNA-binding NarL/FixJ family response regulator